MDPSLSGVLFEELHLAVPAGQGGRPVLWRHWAVAVPEDSALVQVLSYSEPGSLQFGLLVCRYLSKYVFTVKKKNIGKKVDRNNYK